MFGAMVHYLPGPTTVLTGLPDEVHCLLFDVNSSQELLYCGTGNGKLVVWNLREFNVWSTADVSDVPCLSIYKVNNMIATQDKRNCVKIWNLVGREYMCVKIINALPQSTMCKMHVSPDEGLLVKSEVPRSVVAFSHISNTMQLMEAPENYGEAVALRIINFGNIRHVLVFYENRSLSLWNMQTVKMASELVVSECKKEVATAMDYDYINKRGVLGTSGTQIRVFSFRSCAKLVKHKSYYMLSSGVSCLKIRPDYTMVAAGCMDKKVRLFSWKMMTLDLLATLEFHNGIVLDITFSSMRAMHWPRTKFILAMASTDNKITLWDSYLKDEI